MKTTITKGHVRTCPVGESWEMLCVVVPASLYAAVAEEAEKLGVSKSVIARTALQLVLSDAQLREQLREQVLSQPLILKRTVVKKVIVNG